MSQDSAEEVLRLRARVAQLEAAMRWRVTADEYPHDEGEVLSKFMDQPYVYIWQPTGNEKSRGTPDIWLPIPPVPDARP